MSKLAKLRDTWQPGDRPAPPEHQVASTVTVTIDVKKLMKSLHGGDIFESVANALRRAADDYESEQYEYPILMGETWVGWFETEFRKEDKS